MVSGAGEKCTIWGQWPSFSAAAGYTGVIQQKCLTPLKASWSLNQGGKYTTFNTTTERTKDSPVEQEEKEKANQLYG